MRHFWQEIFSPRTAKLSTNAASRCDRRCITKGGYLINIARQILRRLKAVSMPGENYSDVALSCLDVAR